MDTKQLIIYRNLEYQELFEEFAGLLEGAGERKDAGSRESAGERKDAGSRRRRKPEGCLRPGGGACQPADRAGGDLRL